MKYNKTMMERIRIVLAEDHLLVREGVKELIQQQDDMDVVGEASDGEEAVRMVSVLKPDVVLMDIAMPRMNGIDATKEIKKNHPSTAVLILSAYDNEEFVFAIVEAQAAGYLLKTVRGDELLQAVRAVNKGDSVLHPDIANKIFSKLKISAQGKTGEKNKLLTHRELEVIRWGAKGMANKEIAYELRLSDRTVQSHWRNIFAKLCVSSRVEAIMYCVKNDLVHLKDDIKP